MHTVERYLDVSSALEIAARHGVTIYAKPIAVKTWDGRLTKGAKLFLPGYIVTIEVDKRKGSESVEVEPANDCFCNCETSSPDDLVW